MGEPVRRETWREWVPDDADPVLITRAELLAKAERLGLKLDYSTLRYWEAERVIPAPVVEKNGLPGRYPWWMIDLVYQIRRMQDEGLTLDTIRRRVRAEAPFLALWMRYIGNPGREWLLGEYRPPAPTTDPSVRFAWVIEDSQTDLAQIAYGLADFYGKQTANNVEGVSLLIRMTDGDQLSIPLRRPAPADPASKNE